MRKFLIAIAFAALALLSGTATRTDAASLCVGAGGTWHCSGKPYIGDAGAYRTPKNGYVGVGGLWKPFYSTIGASASSVAGSASGAAASGTVATTSSLPNTVISGTPIGVVAYFWSCTAGPCPSIVSQGDLNPRFSASVGSASCQSSVTTNSTWYVAATDAIGTTVNSNNINVALTWNNTTSCVGPFTVSASNSFYNAGECNGGASHSCPFTWLGNSTVTISGGPVSGNMSYSWTYVSGVTPTSTSGTNTANFGMSKSSTCPPATSCTESSTWNVHVIDLVSGYTADAQAQFFGDFLNNTG
jgi:hypothetical protein